MFKKLEENLNKAFEEVTQSVAKQVSKIAMDFVQDMTVLTPVDTSKALSNWQVSVDRPIQEIEAHYLGSRQSTRPQSSAVTVSLAEAILLPRPFGKSLMIGNMTPYIADLNAGKSRQASQGFITNRAAQMFLQLDNVKV